MHIENGIALQQSSSVGSVAKIECLDGTILAGPEVVECLTNNIWSGGDAEPECKRKQTPQENYMLSEFL